MEQTEIKVEVYDEVKQRLDKISAMLEKQTDVFEKMSLMLKDFQIKLGLV